jgi:cyclic beta-1,2-glucan synthetase
MHRAGIDGLLGLTRSGQDITLNPCFPKAWPQIAATVRIGGCSLAMIISNPGLTGHGIASATLDGTPVEPVGGRIRVRLSGPSQQLAVSLGQAGETRA